MTINPIVHHFVNNSFLLPYQGAGRLHLRRDCAGVPGGTGRRVQATHCRLVDIRDFFFEYHGNFPSWELVQFGIFPCPRLKGCTMYRCTVISGKFSALEVVQWGISIYIYVQFPHFRDCTLVQWGKFRQLQIPLTYWENILVWEVVQSGIPP